MPEKQERISTGVKRCLSLFKTGLELVGAYATDGTGTRLSHQRDRFKIWTANIGGHQTGTSSLEYKLRDASNIRRNVLELLHDLAQLLEDFVAIARGEMTPWDELPSENSEAMDEEGPKTEMQQIILHCKDIVDSLLGLSTTIRNPAPHDRFMAASTTEVSFYEKHDINHVRELYSDLLPWQVERLGATISRRRQYFRYRQTHHEKLAFGIDDEQDNKGEKKAPSTLASSLPHEFKTKAFSALREEEQDKQEYMSQTSFATSTDQGNARRIPPLPEEAETGPFECPLCYCIILAQTRQKWKRHVFEDLRPYVCLQGACTEAAYGFAHRRDWISHTRQCHWVDYSCPLEPCGQRFSTSSLFQGHIQANHSSDKLRYGMSTLINLARLEKVNGADLVCPFCRDSQSTEKAHHRHVGRHMEQLSLFALPLIEGEDDSETDSDESRTSLSAHDTAQLSLSAPPMGGGQSDSDGYDGDARSASLEAYLDSSSQGSQRRVSNDMQYSAEMKKYDGDVFSSSSEAFIPRYRTDDQRQFADMQHSAEKKSYNDNAGSFASEDITTSQNSTSHYFSSAAQPRAAYDALSHEIGRLFPFGSRPLAHEETKSWIKEELRRSRQDADRQEYILDAPTSSEPHAATASDSLGPKVWTGTHFLPRFVRAAEVPGEGMCYFYDDGTHCKAIINGEHVNARWGVTEAGKPRKGHLIACVTCREKKIKCDPDYPRCAQCIEFDRVCKIKNAPYDDGAKPPSPEASAAGRRKIDDIYKTGADDDVLLIRSCGVDYPTHFPRHTIGDGKLEVSDVTERAGSMMCLPPREWRSLKLFYNGKQLKDQSEAIREHGIRNNSVITAVLPEDHAHVDALDEKVDIVSETTSLGDSTSHGSANSASPIPGAARSPLQEASALRQRRLDKIANDFETRWLPMCKEYIAKPPVDQRERADKHRRLSEAVLLEVVLKLDEVETDGNPDVRQRRKDLVRKVQDVLKQVDVARGHVDN